MAMTKKSAAVTPAASPASALAAAAPKPRAAASKPAPPRKVAAKAPAKPKPQPVESAAPPVARLPEPTKVVSKAATTGVRVPSAAKNGSAAARVNAGGAVWCEVEPQQRAHYIEVAAFYIAERRGFAPGNPEQDYLQAAEEIDRLIAAGHFAR